MKIQCNACEAAEATVLCCADEAALCWACDEKVHAANKLAGKHQRVPLLFGGSSPRVPKCDICQEASGYFFCLEDRALLCRKCDVAIHTANPHVSAHQRFLVTGVQVGLEPTEPVASFANEQLNYSGKTVEWPSKSVPKRSHSMSLSGETNEVFSSQVVKDEGLAASKMSFSGVTMPGSIPDWPLDEFFGFTDFSQNFGFMEHGSSKVIEESCLDMSFGPYKRTFIMWLTVLSLEVQKGHHSIVLLMKNWMPAIAWARCLRFHGRCQRFLRHPQLQGSTGKETCTILHPSMLPLYLIYATDEVPALPQLLVQSATGHANNLGDMKPTVSRHVI